ncbi:MAG: tyrosine-type recombinase/integrase [Acidobacteriia bacterium]|nr:tyrosine-type recombinase/integrase [Terriglobia bacterium]
MNPAQTVELPRVPPGRVRYLQPTELQILLSHCPDWLKPIVELAVATGMRRGEILSLRHLDVDLTHGCLMLRQTKNGEGRIVPLNAWAQRILTALPSESPTQRLFTVKPAHVTVAFEGACK